MTEIALSVPGFEGRDFKVLDRGMFKPIEIYIDGQKVKRTGFKYIVKDNQGNDCDIKFHHGYFIDPGSALTINGTTVHLREPLKKIEYIFAGLPILLVFIGGAIGGGLGATAASINVKIFRGPWIPFLKYSLTFFISVVTFFLWAVLATIVRQMLS